ncbi:hypothetical protein IEU_05605 [Bacillus mycoides]|nr:hypothetical protein IEU_05605 [Bacillus mycoides]
MERLKDSYTKEESIKALLQERDRWDYDLIECDDYTNRVLYILRWTDNEEEF